MIVKTTIVYPTKLFIGLLPDEHRLTSEFFFRSILESSSVELEKPIIRIYSKVFVKGQFLNPSQFQFPPVSEQHQIVFLPR